MCINRKRQPFSSPLISALKILEVAGQLKKIDGEYKIPINRQDIINRALEFIEEQGFVTTLQIKESLREDDFYVTQGEISDVMTELAVDDTVRATFIETNGKTHRLFYDEAVPEHIAIAAYRVISNS
jgi:hypothetical protein